VPCLMAVMAVMAACAAPGASSPTATPGAPSPTVPSPTPSPISEDDLGTRIRVLATGWRPEVQTAVVAVTEGQQMRFVAVPITGGGSAVPLVEFTNTYSWQLRQDGGAIAVSFLNASRSSSRIAVWDVVTGSARWLTPDQAGVFDDGPAWTPDGSTIYYGEHSATATTFTDRGIFRISLDGGVPLRVHGPDANGGSPVRLTADGRWLIWTRNQAGGSTDVLDLATGENRSFDVTGTSGEIAWRAARPRALVMSGGCCAGRPGGQLILWDDIGGGIREILGAGAAPLVFAGAADWDPTGTRIAATVFERTLVDRSVHDGPFYVAIFEPTGSLTTKVPGSEGFVVIAWLADGILARRSTTEQASEVALLSENGNDRRVLYQMTGTMRFAAIVSP